MRNLEGADCGVELAVLQVFTRTLGSPLRTQVTRSPRDCTDPFWSHDGSRIYFHSLAGSDQALFSVGTAGGEPELLIENASSADLSPDGKTLAFLSPFQRGVEVYVVDVVGQRRLAAPVRLSPGYFSTSQIQWSPDGQWIACHTPDGLVLVPSQGGQARLLSPSPWLAYG